MQNVSVHFMCLSAGRIRGSPRRHAMVAAAKPFRVVAGVPGGSITEGQHRQTITRDVLVPTRDGVLLAMDLMRPDAVGRRPVVLVRTPYNKIASMSSPRAKPLYER